MDSEQKLATSNHILNILTVAVLSLVLAALVYALAPWVENRIQQAVDRTLVGHQITGWSAIVDGRDVILSEQPGASMRAEQLRIVLNDLPGVRMVELNKNPVAQSWMTARNFMFSEFNFDGEKFSLIGTRPFEKHLTVEGVVFNDLSLPSLEAIDYWSSIHESLINNSKTIGAFRLLAKPENYTLMVSDSMVASVEKFEVFKPLFERDILSVSALGPEFSIKALPKPKAKTKNPTKVKKGVSPTPIEVVNESTAERSITPRQSLVSGCQKRLDKAKNGRSINFEMGSFTIGESGVAVIVDLVEALSGCEKLSLDVIGHTDNSGPDELNKILSQKRAEAVLNRMRKIGVNSVKLNAIGEGSKQPLADNNTFDGRKKNRRIEFKIKTDG